jgi:hypothetical protein
VVFSTSFPPKGTGSFQVSTTSSLPKKEKGIIIRKREKREFFIYIFYSFCKIMRLFQNLSVLTTKRRGAWRPPWATAVGV